MNTNPVSISGGYSHQNNIHLSHCMSPAHISGPPIYDVHGDAESCSGGQGRGQVHLDVHTENYSPPTSSCLFSFKEVGILYTRFSFL